MNKNIHNPYEYIHLNVHAVQDAPDLPPHNEERRLHDIENSMIDDTITLIQTLNGSATYPKHLLNPESHEQAPFDTAVFLDKSARPVSRLMRLLWNDISEAKKPGSKFLNIDKHPWLDAMGFNPDEINYEDIDPRDIDLDRMDPALLQEELSHIRALYLRPKDLLAIDEDNLESVWDMPTTLDGKRIAVIDEVKSSGNTLRIATELLKRAIPEATIEGMWWSTPHIIQWDGGEANDHVRQKVAEYVPAWYSKHSTAGRGIEDIDPPQSLESPSKAQRIGANILGTREQNTEKSEIIRRDLGRLASRFINRELIRYSSDAHLPDDEGDARIAHYYRKPAEEVYAQWRKEQGRY